VWRDSFVFATWRNRVWCDHVCVTLLIHVCDMKEIFYFCVFQLVGNMGLTLWRIYATWQVHMCDMTYSYVTHSWHDSCVRVSYIWLEQFVGDVGLTSWHIYVTWHVHMCDMTYSYERNVWLDSCVCIVFHIFDVSSSWVMKTSSCFAVCCSMCCSV